MASMEHFGTQARQSDSSRWLAGATVACGWIDGTSNGHFLPSRLCGRLSASICWRWHGDKRMHGKYSPLRAGPFRQRAGLIRYLFPACEQELGGLAYDRKSNLLYLVQLGAGTTQDSPFEPLPIIHVFRVVS